MTKGLRPLNTSLQLRRGNLSTTAALWHASILCGKREYHANPQTIDMRLDYIHGKAGLKACMWYVCKVVDRLGCKLYKNYIYYTLFLNPQTLRMVQTKEERTNLCWDRRQGCGFYWTRDGPRLLDWELPRPKACFHEDIVREHKGG